MLECACLDDDNDEQLGEAMTARAFGSQSFHAPASQPAPKPGKPATTVVERLENGRWVEHKLYLQSDGIYHESKENM
jgi:hypothetical protein